MAENKKQHKHGNLLPLEMHVEILSRLPPKQLIRFSCVCKSWCAIIKSKSFRKLYQIRLRRKYSHTSSEILMISGMDGASYTYDFDTNVVEKNATTLFTQPNPKFDYYSIASFDGLLLLRYYSKDYYSGLCLINPLTRASRHIRIVSDNTRLDCIFGFGYDHISDHYKILRLPIKLGCWPNYIQQKAIKDAEIYSVNNKSWKKVQICLSETYTENIYVRDKIVLVENKLHWVSWTDTYARAVISSINLETEKYEELPKCDEILTSGGSREVTSLRGGCLHVVNAILQGNDVYDKIDIWRLDECDDGRTTWTLLIHCLVSDLTSKFVGDWAWLWPCAYTHDGQDVLLQMGTSYKEFAHVNLTSGEIWKTNICRSSDLHSWIDIKSMALVVPWTPSLVSPGGYDEATPNVWCDDVSSST